MLKSLSIHTLRLRRWLPYPALLSAVAAFSLGVDVQAQEGDELEEVTITGSRIVRRDMQSNSPIVTVDSEEFENRTGLNIESYLNQLPQFNPASTPVTTEFDVQITAVNSVGIATSSLRGLGANRNLVLVNGHRPVPVNALMVTDLNGIPSAMIERTEIITGGASSTYGADAVGGVLNFIMRDDFEGLQFDSQYGLTQEGDGEESRVTAVVGTDVADGRGNITVAMERYERDPSYEKNRDWQVEEWTDPLTASGDFFLAGTYGLASGGVPPGGSPNAVNINAVNTVFSTRPAGSNICFGGFSCSIAAPTFNFNSDGTVWVNPGAFSGGLAGLERYKGPVDVEFAQQSVFNIFTNSQGTALKWNDTETYIAAPQTRYAFDLSGHYDITDSITFFARGSFTESKTRTRLFPTSGVGGWESLIPYNPTTDSPVNPALNYTDAAVVAGILANPAANANPGFLPTGTLDPDGTGPLLGAQHPVPLELAVLLNSRPVQGQDWQLNFIPKDWFDDRSTVNTVSVWQAESGLRFDLPVKDWTGELYFSHGEANTYNIGNGYYSLERSRQVMRAADYGRNANILGNQASVRPGFGLAAGKCTSGFYNTLFGGNQTPSEDCINAIDAPLQSRTQIQQDVVEVNFQGGVYELPAGEVRGALGFQYRVNDGQFFPDLLQSMNSFDDQVVGVYPAAYMDASTDVTDVYGELMIPLLKDMSFIKSLSVEAGLRHSDYSASDSEYTYKILGDWEVNDWLRFRGGYNLSNRAPNLGELFLGKQMIFTVQTAFGDPCSVRSSSPFGAGGSGNDAVLTGTETNPPALAPGQTVAGAASARLICEAQMGPATANVFYNVADTGAANTGVGFLWIYQQGNENLQTESADTFTAGMVITSPWEDNPWLSGLSGTIDWYKMDISDMINLSSVNYARYLCYGAVPVSNAAEAAAQAATPECQAVTRTLGTTPGFAGAAGDTVVGYDNSASLVTSGLDMAVNWTSAFSDLGFDIPGSLGLNVQATWLDYYKAKVSEQNFDVETDLTGTSGGPFLTGTNGGTYDWRLFGSMSYFLDDMSFSLRWRHLPPAWGDNGHNSQEAIVENNRAVLAGAPGIVLGFTPGTWVETDSYDVFDFSANWVYSEMISVRAGVNNLFDEDPPRANITTGYAPGTVLSAVCSDAGFTAAEGCQNPTSASLVNTGTAAAGFYDVNGRSFYLGLKLSF